MNKAKIINLAQPASITLLAISVFTSPFIIKSELSKFTKEINRAILSSRLSSTPVTNDTSISGSVTTYLNQGKNERNPLFVVICKRSGSYGSNNNYPACGL